MPTLPLGEDVADDGGQHVQHTSGSAVAGAVTVATAAMASVFPAAFNACRVRWR
ncbi:MAG: hypothetical protein OXI08_06995 [Cyanobacteria bacterium MAG IRC4_bin_6]|nr:hypothetical protein [Cyanobacteria bacterium MAG IRC3_bin_20]MDE0647774.1 hypothetical protein [Cyanobacteria bacterium MAG IRC4_bin_6]